MPKSRFAALLRLIDRGIETLFPGYFALVMATGILSISAHLLEMHGIALALLWVDVVAYVILLILFGVRLVRYFPRVLEDLQSPSLGPGFFTLVAATSVTGAQLHVVAGETTLPTILWGVGIGLWIVVMYSFLTAVIVRKQKPNLRFGISGAWLVMVVATQSVSLLGTLLAPDFTGGREVAIFFTLCMYLTGAMLYLTIITLIFYRFTFLALSTDHLTPAYWINMGAVAITTLAGATLILHEDAWGFLAELRPFLLGFTLFFWAAGTWWIPLLLILGFWRHVLEKYPLRYDPQYWSSVFPLGMYTAATYRLAVASGLDFLTNIPAYSIWVAYAAWVATALGLLHHLIASAIRA